MPFNITGISKQNLNISSTYLEEPQGQLKAYLFDLRPVCIHPQAAKEETNYSHPLSTQIKYILQEHPPFTDRVPLLRAIWSLQ